MGLGREKFLSRKYCIWSFVTPTLKLLHEPPKLEGLSVGKFQPAWCTCSVRGLFWGRFHNVNSSDTGVAFSDLDQTDQIRCENWAFSFKCNNAFFPSVKIHIKSFLCANSDFISVEQKRKLSEKKHLSFIWNVNPPSWCWNLSETCCSVDLKSDRSISRLHLWPSGTQFKWEFYWFGLWVGLDIFSFQFILVEIKKF